MNKNITRITGATLAVLLLGGCVGETFQRGYQVPPDALSFVSPGSSRDQVELTLGTPTTTADFGGEVYYYVSQTARRPLAFMNERIVDQRVIAVYFTPDEKVARVADYRLQDGQVVDFVSRTTPTTGRDFSFLRQLLSSAARPAGFGG